MNKSILFLLAILFPLLLLTGCAPKKPELGSSNLAIPGKDDVKILPRPYPTAKGSRRYQWSLIGGRNWKTATVDGFNLRLSDSYPINDIKTRGGCFTWTCDLILHDAENGKPATWETILHGTVGTTRRSTGTLPNGVTPDSLQIKFNRDATRNVNDTIELARLGDQKLTLRLK